MIPKVIHRMWLDKKIKDNLTVPKKYDPFIKSFEIHNPDFEFKLWNMENVTKLFTDHPTISKYYKTWLNLPSHIQKCDVARFIIIYLFGGIYADLDFMCFKPLEPLLQRQLLLCFEPTEHSKMFNDPINARLCNGFIGSVPKHQFWLDWLDFIIKSLAKTSDVMYTTGPVNFRLFFNQSAYSNTPVVSTCDILPFYLDSGQIYVTESCRHRNQGSKQIKDDSYYKKFGNYAHTKWIEGSGWGSEQLEGFQNLSNDQNNSRAIWLVIIVVLLFLLLKI